MSYCMNTRINLLLFRLDLQPKRLDTEFFFPGIILRSVRSVQAGTGKLSNCVLDGVGFALQSVLHGVRVFQCRFNRDINFPVLVDTHLDSLSLHRSYYYQGTFYAA